MFVPTESVLEILLRGTIMYMGMFVLLRIFRRQAGTVGIADLLVVVVIADAAQNGMAGDSRSITEALLLISTIVVWDWAFDWMGYRSPLFERLISPKPLLLIKNGRVIGRNLRREMITEDELESQLRLQGIEDRKKVRECYLESNGRFSFLTEDDAKEKKGGRRNDDSIGAAG